MRTKVFSGDLNGEKVELTVTSFSVLQQLQFMSIQDEYDNITRKMDATRKKAADENRPLNEEERKEINALQEKSVRKLADIVINAMLKHHPDYKFQGEGETLAADIKMKQDKLLGMFDLGELMNIMSFAFGATSLPETPTE